jgi:hypothetical protein
MPARYEFAEDSLRSRRRSGPRIGLLIGVGLLLLGASCSGRGPSGAADGDSSAEEKVRPTRDLPMDMFAYVPASPKYIRYADVRLGREVEDDASQLVIDGVFPNAMREPAKLRYVCSTSNSANKVPANYLLAYESPVDLAAVAAELKLQPLTGKLSRVFVGRFETNEYAIFQPAPTKLFVACSLTRNKSTKPSEQLLEELLARDPSASALPADLVAGLTAVSGYPAITVQKESAGDHPHTLFTGSVTKSSIKDRYVLTESYQVRQFATEAAARAWSDRPAPKSKAEILEDHRWLRGDLLHTFRRTKTKF